MKLSTIFKNGFVKENPVFVQFLGMCPVLAVTTSAENGLGMGLASTAVLLGSNLVISLIKSFIPNKIRIPCYIVVIATFVTLVGMIMEAFLDGLHAELGLFIPLIVVNCLILGRAESFASKNSTLDSLVDGISMGLGFTAALVILGMTRELLGTGSVFGINLLGENYPHAGIMVAPPGAFLALGVLTAAFNKIFKKNKI